MNKLTSQNRPRFPVEECVNEKGKRAWTVYDTSHHSLIGQKLGLWDNRRAAKRYADKLTSECAPTK